MSDTGIGIRPENHDKVFEEFAQLDIQSQLPIYDIVIDPMDVYFLNTDVFNDVYVPGSFDAGGYAEPDARTRYRGGIGRLFSKKSYNVRLDGRPMLGKDKAAVLPLASS